MEIKLSNKTVIINRPKGKHLKKGFKLLTGMMDKGDESPEALDKYMDYIDELASELTGIPVEELDEMDCNDKDLITNYVQGRIGSRLDFLRSSLSPAGFPP